MTNNLNELNSLIAWNDGDFKPIHDVAISPLDFGFIHSDATYDVMRIKDREILYYDLHLERFQKSCDFYGFKCIKDIKFISDMLISMNDLSNAFLWMCIWRGTPPTGSPRDLSGPQHEFMYVKPYYPISSKPITLCLVDEFKRAHGYQEYKNFCWRELTYAQRKANERGFDSGLVRDVLGNISEGPGFSICFVKDNEVHTPLSDVLDSITVKIVEKICKENNIVFKRVNITDHNIYDEAFICSTSGGITEVNNIEEKQYSSNLTKMLKTLL
jgi:branched-chain amino acid aminotransferase